MPKKREYIPESIYYVDAGETRRAEFPDVLVTDSVNTCIAIGILNQNEKLGYLGHFFSGRFSTAEHLLDQAITEATHPNQLIIALAGNNILTPDEVDLSYQYCLELAQANRKNIEDLVTKRGLSVAQNKLFILPTLPPKAYRPECHKVTVNTRKRVIRIKKEIIV